MLDKDLSVFYIANISYCNIIIRIIRIIIEFRSYLLELIPRLTAEFTERLRNLLFYIYISRNTYIIQYSLSPRQNLLSPVSFTSIGYSNILLQIIYNLFLADISISFTVPLMIVLNFVSVGRDSY